MLPHPAAREHRGRHEEQRDVRQDRIADLQLRLAEPACAELHRDLADAASAQHPAQHQLGHRGEPAGAEVRPLQHVAAVRAIQAGEGVHVLADESLVEPGHRAAEGRAEPAGAGRARCPDATAMPSRCRRPARRDGPARAAARGDRCSRCRWCTRSARARARSRCASRRRVRGSCRAARRASRVACGRR